MKTALFAISFFMLVAFASCNLSGSSNFTPELFVNLSHINKSDTLYIYPTDEGVYRSDTLFTGDTIVMRMYLDGKANNLTDFYLTQSDTSTAKIILPVKLSLDSIFSAKSDYGKGKFVFLPEEVFVYFPVRYVAKKASKDALLQFTLSSDAKFENEIGSNTVTIKLKTPIKDRILE